MTPTLIFFLVWATVGLVAFWIYILTIYNVRDQVDGEDLINGIVHWLLGPIGLFAAVVFWGSKIGWKYKIITRKQKW